MDTASFVVVSRREIFLACHLCRRNRYQYGGTYDALVNRLLREGWSRGKLDFHAPGRMHPESVIRCSRCTREHGEPAPIGPWEGPYYHQRPHPAHD